MSFLQLILHLFLDHPSLLSWCLYFVPCCITCVVLHVISFQAKFCYLNFQMLDRMAFRTFVGQKERDDRHTTLCLSSLPFNDNVPIQFLHIKGFFCQYQNY